MSPQVSLTLIAATCCCCVSGILFTSCLMQSSSSSPALGRLFWYFSCQMFSVAQRSGLQAGRDAGFWRADGGRMAARLCSVCLFFPNRISSSRNLFFQVASVILNERLGSFTYSCFFTQLERSPAFVHAWWTGAVFNVKMSVVHFNPYHGRYYETCFPLVQKCQVNT